MYIMCRATVTLFFLFVALTAAVAAQAPQRRPAAFNSLKAFRCNFTESEGRRIAGDGAATPARQEIFNDLRIDRVDYANKTARRMDNAPFAEQFPENLMLQLFDSDVIVTFLEATTAGNINVLSIFKMARSGNGYRAVYSRHWAYAVGGITMSQSYGTCSGS